MLFADDHLDKSLEILDRGVRATSECTPTISDHQDYYKILVTNTTGSIDNYWIELKDDSKHDRMSASPGTYELVNLTFRFPFYDHTISQVHLSTAGVMSMVADFHDSPVLHYITPFNGSFNPSHSNDSAIYLEIINETFIVEWRNVFLRVATGHLGPYQFQTIIDKDGIIFFLYKKIPDDSPHYSTALNSGI